MCVCQGGGAAGGDSYFACLRIPVGRETLIQYRRNWPMRIRHDQSRRGANGITSVRAVSRAGELPKVVVGSVACTSAGKRNRLEIASPLIPPPRARQLYGRGERLHSTKPQAARLPRLIFAYFLPAPHGTRHRNEARGACRQNGLCEKRTFHHFYLVLRICVSPPPPPPPGAKKLKKI